MHGARPQWRKAGVRHAGVAFADCCNEPCDWACCQRDHGTSRLLHTHSDIQRATLHSGRGTGGDTSAGASPSSMLSSGTCPQRPPDECPRRMRTTHTCSVLHCTPSDSLQLRSCARPSPETSRSARDSFPQAVGHTRTSSKWLPGVVTGTTSRVTKTCSASEQRPVSRGARMQGGRMPTL